MFSSLLLVAMTTSPMQTEGLFFNRGSCSGSVAAASTGCSGSRMAVRTRVRAVVETTVRRPVATLLANRPRLFARSGCNGNVAVASTGCTGGVAVAVAQAPPVYQPMPQPETVGAFGKRIERVAVHRQLRVALRNGNLTPEQAKIAKRALDDPDVYEAAVSKVTHDLKTMKVPVGAGPVGKIGDGTILKMLLDNLPAIIDAIKQIIQLFS